MTNRLEQAEFSIPGVFVADIGTVCGPSMALDGSTSIAIEALTIADD